MVHFSYEGYTMFHKTWYHSRESNINEQLRLAWSISLTKVILCFIKRSITLASQLSMSSSDLHGPFQLQRLYYVS